MRLETAFARLHSLAVLSLVVILPVAWWTPFHDCFPLSKLLAAVVFGGVVLGFGRGWPGGAGLAWRGFAWLPFWTGWVGVAALAGAAAPGRAWPEAVVLVLPVWIAVAARGASASRIARALVAVAALLAGYGLLQATGWDLGVWISPFHKGVASTIGNPDLFGGFLVLPFALALSSALSPPVPGLRAGGRWLVVAVIGAAVLATEARAAWLAAAVTAVALLRPVPPRRAAIAAGAGAVVALCCVLHPAVRRTALSGGALVERAWTWGVAARAVRESPLTGSGPGSFRETYLRHQTASRDRGESFYHYSEFAHLELLHFLAETGVVGLGVWIWGLLSAFSLWRGSPLRDRSPSLWRGLGAGALGILVNSLFSFPFHVLPTIVPAWLLLVLGGDRGGVQSTKYKVQRAERGLRSPEALRSASPAEPISGLCTLFRLGVPAVLLAVPFRLAYVSAALNDGQVLALAGRPEDARARYATAMRLRGGDFRLPWYAAAAARQGGDLAGALALVERGLELEPDFCELEYLRGMILNDLGRAPEAAAAYRAAVRINPGYALAWNNLGNILGRAGRLAEAEAAQRRALALDLRLDEARQNLAITLTLLGRREEAGRILAGGHP